MCFVGECDVISVILRNNEKMQIKIACLMILIGKLFSTTAAF